MKKIAFVVQLPKYVSPGQRFRFEQYEQLLVANNFEIETFPFLDEKTHRILYKNGYTLQKIAGVCKGFVRRFKFLFRVRKFDYIFLQREMAPLGPPIFEWIASRLLKAKVIYDFDDAIWIPNVSKSNKLAGAVKCFWKVKWICRWASKVSVGNDFLAEYAKKYNSVVVYNPTCVDTDERYNRIASVVNQPIVVGWTGSHSTISYLNQFQPILKEVEKNKHFAFLTICDRQPDISLKSLKYLPWKADTEIDDLLQMDIGIMPLKKDFWSEGKCGFKLIQYMALGIPALASPVGVNSKIIEHGYNGFLCTTDAEWIHYLTVLLEDSDLRKKLGDNGRQKVKALYSITSNTDNFLSLFRD